MCFASDKNASTVLHKQIIYQSRFVSKVDFIRNTRNTGLCCTLFMSAKKLSMLEIELKVKVLFVLFYVHFNTKLMGDTLFENCILTSVTVA